MASNNNSREFTFAAPANMEQSFESLESLSSSADRSSLPTADDHDESEDSGIMGEVASIESAPVEQILDGAGGGEVIDADVVLESTLPPDDHPEVQQKRHFYDKIADWFWYTDESNRNTELPAALNQEALIHPTQIAPEEAERPAAAPPPVPVPIPALNAAHEPNIQFGNDANGIDEAEELEGILELIGMEGPIAGMIQNFIFSVFLISITLTVSVWCPYIWGQVALSIMTHPIALCIKAPLALLSRVANFLLDLLLLLAGMLGLTLTSITGIVKYLLVLTSPGVGKYIKLNAAEAFAASITRSSSVRLEKALTVTLFSMRPKFPTYAMTTLHTLRTLRVGFEDVINAIGKDILGSVLRAQESWQSYGVLSLPVFICQELTTFPYALAGATRQISGWVIRLSSDLKLPHDVNDIDLSLLEPSTLDIVLTTIIGYGFFALSGSLYLKLARVYQGLGSDERVEGFFADSFRQAGGVMKVIFIIGLEMLFFPLYCGCLLDIALLPLFKDASLYSRWQFVKAAPITGFFMHWFIGTCYMFHFALFVSMCRKIMRTGVLYFIRDPDDPTFHPVRDVLERPVLTQLGKIAFSAFVYGGLLLICLGGVIWTIASTGVVFPIQWATNEPRLAFPVDVVFFNFFLPFVIRTAEPSKKITAICTWWFKKCARYLRLSNFLFGDDQPDEKASRGWFGLGSFNKNNSVSRFAEKLATNMPGEDHLDGTWVRAPASDAVRIPKGRKVFLEVDKDNNRKDGQEDRSQGLHGRDDDRFAKIFIPSYFRTRIAAFIFLVWLFAACTGALATLGPLLAGRAALYFAAGSKVSPNDLYAFTVGIHLTGAAYLLAIQIKMRSWSGLFSNVWATSLRLVMRVRYVFGVLYLAVTFGLLIPILLSLLAELYIHMPIYEHLMKSTKQSRGSSHFAANIGDHATTPTIHLAQSWTLGVLFLRLLLRAAVRYPNTHTRLARAVRAIIRDGPLQPDVRLASRALVLPLLLSSIVLLTLPLIIAQVYMITFGAGEDGRLTVYRDAYPVLLLTGLVIYTAHSLWHKIESWQLQIRDEVYLVGERLHNFADTEAKKTVRRDVTQGSGKLTQITEVEGFDETGHVEPSQTDIDIDDQSELVQTSSVARNVAPRLSGSSAGHV